MHEALCIGLTTIYNLSRIRTTQYLPIIKEDSNMRLKDLTDVNTLSVRDSKLIRLNTSVRDLMFKIQDGECHPTALKHYLDVVVPNDTVDGFILPKIGSEELMRRIANAFSVPTFNLDNGELRHIH